MKKFMPLLIVLIVIGAAIGGIVWLRMPRPSEKVVSSQGKDVFHVPSCKWARKINSDYKARYSSPSKALEDGLRPCKVCRDLMIDLPRDWEDHRRIPDRTGEYERAWEERYPD